MSQERIIPAAGGVGVRLRKGERLRVIDPQGGQSGDVFAVSADGAHSFRPPPSRPGAAITFRAEMDLAVALSSCPTSTCNGGQPPRPLAFEVLPPG